MTLSDIAVRRPVAAMVFAMILCIVGLVAFSRLPLRELPNVDPPQVTVSTNYVGASSEVIEQRITQPLARQLAGIPGIDRMTSNDRDGRSAINITFTLDRNIEDAANDVRDRVSRVLSQLPQDAQAPQITKADADGDPILVLDMTSTTMGRVELSDYIDRNIVPRLSTIPGVAQATAFGSQLYAMRVWVDPDALSSRGLSVEDITTALSRNNIQLPAGSLETADKDYTINVQRSYATPADFAAMPLTTVQGGYVVRLGDVARVEEGPDDRRRLFQSNGVEMVGVGILRQADGNDLKISDDVHKAVDEINKALPKGTKVGIAYDNSTFTRDAVKEVWMTMVLAIMLVGGVNFLFLGTWQAALIPTIVAPICILSTFTLLEPLGFSLNLLTLLALVLATGLVVDDAIVVVENIQRRIDEGEPPIVAAQRGARQVFFAVLATTMTLIAVFTPLMFLPGYTGRLFVELAVAVAASVFFSAILALTLSPVLASKLLKPATSRGKLATLIDTTMNKVRDSYRHSLTDLIKKPIAATVAILVVLFIGAGAALMFVSLPKELVPDEDRGRVDFQIQGPDGAGFDYILKPLAQVRDILNKELKSGEGDRWVLTAPTNAQAAQYNGANGNLLLVPWKDRKRTAQQVAADINRQTSSITAARVTATVRGPFQRGGGGGGGGGGNTVQFIATGDDFAQLGAWTAPILAEAQTNPGFARAQTNYEPIAPRLYVTLDRDKAAELGVSAQQVADALNVMFGPQRATTYVRNGQEYDVLLETTRGNRSTLDDLERVYVKSAGGGQVPLSNVVHTDLKGDLATRSRVDQQRSVTLSATLNPGYTVPQAIDWFNAVAAKQPIGPVVKWGGAAKDYLDAGNSVIYAFGFALIVVFLVLSAQFESFIHPAIIMFTVPLAAAGGLFGLLMTGSSLNLYSQIGLVILIGIAAKNGILIVEFANQLRDEGHSVLEAVIESASLRLRPIIMTSIATAAGAVPLAMSSGPGSNSRHTIGAVIIAGCLFSTLLTLFVVPTMYQLLARFTRSPEWAAKQIEEYEVEEGANDRLPVPAAAE